MIEKADSEELVRQAMAEPGRQNMRQVIEKELLQADILFSLEKEGLLDGLTFQGGISLRLCQGSNRFSEDLDFVSDRDFASQHMARIKQCVEDYLGNRYQLEVMATEPKELRREPDYAGVGIDKWQVLAISSSTQRDASKQHIMLKIVNAPVYTREARNLSIHYSFLPDGYSDFLILTKTLDEVMADKLVSLPNTINRVCYFDIWDLHWLRQQGARPNINLVQKKLSDYGVKGYVEKARSIQQRLPEIIGNSGFHDEMARFLPTTVLDRTLKQPKFSVYLSNENRQLLGQVIDALEGPAPSEPRFEFMM